MYDVFVVEIGFIISYVYIYFYSPGCSLVRSNYSSFVYIYPLIILFSSK